MITKRWDRNAGLLGNLKHRQVLTHLERLTIDGYTDHPFFSCFDRGLHLRQLVILLPSAQA